MRGLDISDYEWLQTHDVQPTDGTQGATVTPGNNTMGSWADVYTTPLSGDYHGIEVIIHSNSPSDGVNRHSLTDLGWDPAGGTNYGASALSIIPYLYSGFAAGQGSLLTGLRIFLPVLIPSGSTLGARSQVDNATVGTQKVYCKLYKAKRPHDALFGTQVVSFGETTASSKGTAVTIGVTGAEGSWTQIAASLAKPTPFWWTAAGARAGTIAFNAALVRLDIGFGSSTTNARRCVCEWSSTGTTEQRGSRQWGGIGRPADGDNLYVKGSTSGGVGDWSVVVHGVI